MPKCKCGKCEWDRLTDLSEDWGTYSIGWSSWVFCPECKKTIKAKLQKLHEARDELQEYLGVEIRI